MWKSCDKKEKNAKFIKYSRNKKHEIYQTILKEKYMYINLKNDCRKKS